LEIGRVEGGQADGVDGGAQGDDGGEPDQGNVCAAINNKINEMTQ